MGIIFDTQYVKYSTRYIYIYIYIIDNRKKVTDKWYIHLGSTIVVKLDFVCGGG